MVLILFSLMEFLWRIFPPLRANRPYAIFNTGLKKNGFFNPKYFYVFSYPGVLALAPSATSPVQQLTFSFRFFADGKKVPLPF